MLLDARPHIPALLGGEENNFLVDTGASVSVTCNPLPTINETLNLTGFNGQVTAYRKSVPISLQFTPQDPPIWVQFWVGPCQEGSIIGIDILHQIEAKILLDVHEIDSPLFARALPLHIGKGNQSVASVSAPAPSPIHTLIVTHFPDTLWAQTKTDVGHCDKITPLDVNGPMHSPVRQYPLKREAQTAAAQIVKELEQQGVVIRCSSPTNSPIWPVKKPDGSYRLTIDYTALNAVTAKMTPLVANPSTILTSLGPHHVMFSALDISNGFYSVPITPESVPRFAFTIGDTQYSLTRLPQGYCDSPSLFHQVVAESVASVVNSCAPSCILQYCDDLLIASPNKVHHVATLIRLLKALTIAGFKLNLRKAQIGLSEITFLGQRIGSHGRAPLPERIEAICKLPKPTTVSGLRSVLGLLNYNRQYIPEFSDIAKPLNESLKGGLAGSVRLSWTPEMEEAFTLLKSSLASTPALKHPDLSKPFHLWSHVGSHGYSAVLGQPQACGGHGTIGYFSTLIPHTILGQAPCLMALDCAEWAMKIVEPLVGYSAIVLHTPHKCIQLLTNTSIKTISMQRRARWETALLSSHITVESDTRYNPAMGVISQGEPHECTDWLIISKDHHISDEPVPHSRHVFVDGSSFCEGDKRYTGWALTDDKAVILSGALPTGSAQVAELVAMVNAIQWGIEQQAPTTIFTDSAYVFHTVHSYGPVWKKRGYLTTTQTPISHASKITTLMELLTQVPPNKLAVCKTTAHSTVSSKEQEGNDRADIAAKAAAKGAVSLGVAALAPAQTAPLTVLKEMYTSDDVSEIQQWEGNPVCGEDGLWRLNEKVISPLSYRSTLVQIYHELGHHGAKVTADLIQKTWFWDTLVKDCQVICNRCVTCLKVKPLNRRSKIPMGHSERPIGPFTHLQIDFIGPLPPSGGYTYVLVIVDKFSRWVEAWPVKSATAKATAKILMRDIFPRWGIPLSIDSDQGTHFTGSIMKEAMRQLGVKQKFHIAYHPQSSGMVENRNRELKLRLKAQLCDHGGSWFQYLPIVLMAMRCTPVKTLGLSPFEICMGRAMPLPYDAPTPPGEGTSDPYRDMLTQYLKLLSVTLQNDHFKAFAFQHRTDDKNQFDLECQYKANIGDKVMVQNIGVLKPLQAKFKGPFPVMLATPTSVLVDTGKSTFKWYHLSQTKRLPD